MAIKKIRNWMRAKYMKAMSVPRNVGYWIEENPKKTAAVSCTLSFFMGLAIGHSL